MRAAQPAGRAPTEQSFRVAFPGSFRLCLLAIALGGWLVQPLPAQPFQNLHNFAGGADGSSPMAGMVLSGNTLYGTSSGIYDAVYGTVFAINTDGSGYTILHLFSGGSDGGNPFAGLILSGNTLYGTTARGGATGDGAVFATKTDGSGFRVLWSFYDQGSGSYPNGGLVLSGNTLYGTTEYSGASANGTVFRVNTDGTHFATIYSFTGGRTGGAWPTAGLVLSSNLLYGTTTGGGAAQGGTVFSVNTNGTGFIIIHGFGGSYGSDPYAGLILSGDTLYGTTPTGGDWAGGSVFALKTDGSGFRTLHSFVPLPPLTYANAYGCNPYAGVVLSGNTLYGATAGGGIGAYGTLFSVHTDGTGFQTLYWFTSLIFSNINGDGADPYGSLVVSGNVLYGTGSGGGSDGYGALFSLPVPVPPVSLSINTSGGNLILTWPAEAAGYTLLATTNLASPAWTPVSAVPVVLGGLNVVTNPASGVQQFFQLSQAGWALP